MKRKDVFKLFLAFALIGLIIFLLYKKGYFSVMENISLFDFSILISLTLLSYFVAGFQIFYLVKKQNKISLSFADTLLLPIAMSLFSYVIPTNGGLIYSAFFLKQKYHIHPTKGFSIGIFSVYISLIITGIFGIVFYFFPGNHNAWVLMASIILIFLSLIINLVNRIIQRLNLKRFVVLRKLQSYVDRIVIHSNNLIMDKETMIVNIVINIVYLILAFVAYEWLNIVVKTDLPLFSVFIILLITRISSLLRFLPGNLGLEELYTAGIFSLLGKDPAIGVIFSLLLRFSTICLFVPLGILHTIYNSEPLKLRNLKNILSNNENK